MGLGATEPGGAMILKIRGTRNVAIYNEPVNRDTVYQIPIVEACRCRTVDFTDDSGRHLLDITWNQILLQKKDILKFTLGEPDVVKIQVAPLDKPSA
jgi:hypothetical protein